MEKRAERRYSKSLSAIQKKEMSVSLSRGKRGEIAGVSRMGIRGEEGGKRRIKWGTSLRPKKYLAALISQEGETCDFRFQIA